MNTQCTIVEYQPQYKGTFKQLNLEWIETFFEVEPLDLQYLDNPESEILSKGGMIFMALIDGTAVGTVALIKHTEDLYELSKMAVHPPFQGKGIGKQLMNASLDWAKKQEAKEIELITNTKLDRAMSLYTHTGFIAQPLDELQTEYSRGNLRMLLTLK